MSVALDVMGWNHCGNNAPSNVAKSPEKPRLYAVPTAPSAPVAPTKDAFNTGELNVSSSIAHTPIHMAKYVRRPQRPSATLRQARVHHMGERHSLELSENAATKIISLAKNTIIFGILGISGLLLGSHMQSAGGGDVVEQPRITQSSVEYVIPAAGMGQGR